MAVIDRSDKKHDINEYYMICYSIINLLMTTLHPQQGKILRGKKQAHLRLFETQSPSNRKMHFESIYEQFKREAQQATKTYNQKDLGKKTQQMQEQNCTQGNIVNHKNPSSRNNHLEVHIEANDKRIRAFSSNKFDCLPNKPTQRKGKKFIKYLFEMAKQVDQKEGSSKKSTDDSNSSEIQKMKEENIHFEQRIQMEQRKARLLEKQIAEEKKRHELQKQLYQHNIQRLKKKVVGKEGQQLQELQQLLNNQQQFDRLSIESN